MPKTMEIKKNLILGLTDYSVRRSPLFREINDEQLIAHCSWKQSLNGRLLLALGQYLQHTNKFDRISAYITNEGSVIFPNGTSGGITAKMNRSEVDINVSPLHCEEISMGIVDFSYPYKIHDFTFVTFIPEYKPHIFGIFQAFSLNFWITLVSVLFAIMLLSHFMLKYKCNIGKTVFHVFAILMKQNAIITPTYFAENLLVYSWVIGAMILCLSYDSVFLSFLSVPPVTKIKHLSDLAMAVQKGDYNCVAVKNQGVVEYFRKTNQKHLEIIADDISKNYFRIHSLIYNFHHGNKSAEIAYFTATSLLELFAGKFFNSGDRFYQEISAMSVRRSFCCKELVDAFVHKMMASGIYLKYLSDFTFLWSSIVGIMENETTNRQLTLTDLAPAFIFLLCGHFTSLLVFCWEMMSSRRNKRILKKVKKKRRKNMCKECSA